MTPRYRVLEGPNKGFEGTISQIGVLGVERHISLWGKRDMKEPERHIVTHECNLEAIPAERAEPSPRQSAKVNNFDFDFDFDFAQSPVDWAIGTDFASLEVRTMARMDRMIAIDLETWPMLYATRSRPELQNLPFIHDEEQITIKAPSRRYGKTAVEQGQNLHAHLDKFFAPIEGEIVKWHEMLSKAAHEMCAIKDPRPMAFNREELDRAAGSIVVAHDVNHPRQTGYHVGGLTFMSLEQVDRHIRELTTRVEKAEAQASSHKFAVSSLSRMIDEVKDVLRPMADLGIDTTVVDTTKRLVARVTELDDEGSDDAVAERCDVLAYLRNALDERDNTGTPNELLEELVLAFERGDHEGDHELCFGELKSVEVSTTRGLTSDTADALRLSLGVDRRKMIGTVVSVIHNDPYGFPYTEAWVHTAKAGQFKHLVARGFEPAAGQAVALDDAGKLIPYADPTPVYHTDAYRLATCIGEDLDAFAATMNLTRAPGESDQSLRESTIRAYRSAGAVNVPVSGRYPLRTDGREDPRIVQMAQGECVEVDHLGPTKPVSTLVPHVSSVPAVTYGGGYFVERDGEPTWVQAPESRATTSRF